MNRGTRIIILTLAVATTGFLTLKPDPGVDHLGLPRKVVWFFVEHDFLANYLGFLFLTALAGWALPRKTSILLPAFGGILVIAALLELAQLFLPHRFCTLRDVAAAWLGVATVGLPLILIHMRGGATERRRE